MTADAAAPAPASAPMPEVAAIALQGQGAADLIRRLAVALALGFVLLLAVAGLVAWLTVEQEGIAQTVEEQYQLEVLGADMLSAIRSAESGARGYFISGDRAFLESFDSIRQTVDVALGRISARTAPDSEQGPVLARVRELVEARLRQLEGLVRRLEQGDQEGARSIITAPGTIETRREMRDELARLRSLQRGELIRARGEQGRNRIVLLVALGLALAAIGAIAALAVVVVRRAMRELRGSYASLQTLAASLEDQVAERTQSLTEANKEIQRFAYIVSHDLRSPLVNIMGFTDELGANLKTLDRMVTRVDEAQPGLLEADERVSVREDIPEALGFIKASTEKMDRLINAILRLSREGRRPLAAERIDPKAMVEDIARSLEKQAEARNAVIEVGALPTIMSDRLAVEQVLSNLVENAVKYGHGDRLNRITVSGRREAGRILIDIADTGRGIAATDRTRVFELFRRAGRQDQPGEGLGLAFVQALVRRLGGQVSVADNPGGGSIFRVDLPYAMPLDVKKG